MVISILYCLFNFFKDIILLIYCYVLTYVLYTVYLTSVAKINFCINNNN